MLAFINPTQSLRLNRLATGFCTASNLSMGLGYFVERLAIILPQWGASGPLAEYRRD
jgi:hypothetical protein